MKLYTIIDKIKCKYIEEEINSANIHKDTPFEDALIEIQRIFRKFYPNITNIL